MKKLLVIALLLSAGAAYAETSSPVPVPGPGEIPNSPMVRNIGFAEQGDAIIVRERKAAPAPETKAPADKPEQK